MAFLGRQGVTAPLTSADIPDNIIGTAHLADDTITISDIGADAVGSDELANNVVIDTSGAITTTGGMTVDGAAVFNEASADVDFRIESEDRTHAFFVDASTNSIGINDPSPPAWAALCVARSAASENINIRCFSTTITHAPYINLTKSHHGTIGTYSATQTGGVLGGINFVGVDTASGDETAAAIVVTQDGAAGAYVPGKIEFKTATSSANIASRMFIHSGGELSIGTDTTNNALHVTTTGSQEYCTTFVHGGTNGNKQMILFSNTATNMDSRLLAVQTQTEDGAGFEFIRCRGASNDEEFKVLGNGAILHDGSITSNQGDYAEYFESVDGSAIPVGTSVVLENGKVKVAESGESPIGVVRPDSTAVVVGNAGWNKWDLKYLRDDYGRPLREDYTSTEWGEGEDKKIYHTDRIPDDVEVPEDAEVVSQFADGRNLNRRKLNPDFDPDLEYIPRSERDEWNLIGLLGQVPIAKDQPVATSWIKMRDVSDTVEMWFIK